MTEWTDTARAELEAFVGRVRAGLAGSDADADEVVDDLKRHVEAEVAAAGLPVVTREDIRRIAARVGAPESDPAPDPPPPPAPLPADPADHRGRPVGGLHPFSLVCLVLFGVLLPAATLAIELVSGMCAAVFFDPAPTVWHAALIAAVPVANAVAIWVLAPRGGRWARTVGWTNGVAVGISGYYAVLFLPLSPFAVLGIMYFGLGFLPLAPLCALIVALVLRTKGRRVAGDASGPTWTGVIPGVLLVLIALVILELPKTITVVGQQMAASSDVEERVRGIRLLRHFGSDDALLRSCYVRAGINMDVVGFTYSLFADPVSPEQAREIYYRVTGTPFNAVEPPPLRSRRGAFMPAEDFDFGVGGDEVEARLRSVTLESSRIDASVDADGGVSYAEWTMTFKNVSRWQQHEARAQIALPSGGVVSRLTLWVDGEEREAAFAGRAETKAAYKNVVRRRRDPVLVTTMGPDRILMQCFPVPPNGGTMKIRIGITAPLFAGEPGRPLLPLPRFVERNFGLGPGVGHSIWVEGRQPLSVYGSGGDVIVEQPDERTHALRGIISDALLEGGFVVSAEPTEAAVEAWTADHHEGPGVIIQQTLRKVKSSPPQRLVIVVDGSARMADYIEDLAGGLARLGGGPEVCVLLAGDEVTEMLPVSEGTPGAFARASEALSDAAFVGGCDDMPALLRAWDIAAQKPRSAILWLHATQPVEITSAELLRQKWERRPGNPVLYVAQFGGGPNQILRSLGRLAPVRSIPGYGRSLTDLMALLTRWHGSGEVFQLERRRQTVGEGIAPPGHETSSHLARLWAHDRVVALAASGSPEDRTRALELAAAYQLVTTVSGAVVLETAQQYQAAGLEPVDNATVPTIPEPETWALIIAGGCVLVWFLFRQFRQQRKLRCSQSCSS